MNLNLEQLNARVKQDLEYLAYPDKPWVKEVSQDILKTLPAGIHAQDVLNCAIIGGGQFGLTIAHGLSMERVERVRIFERNPKGKEGPWSTFARMSMLRTPKRHTGHELGNASLTFQAWYEAQHGTEGWDALFRISRKDWQGYLGWYREVTGADMVNDTEVVDVQPWPNAQRCELFRLTLRQGSAQQHVWARTVVFSSGAEGSGGHQVPAFIANSLPKHLYAHTSEWPIDFAAFAGKRIGLLGSGAASFDAAIAALEHGAKEAVLCFRRDKLPLTNPRRWMEFCGYLAHYPSLPDADKWAYLQKLYDIGQPPPQPTYDKAAAFDNFTLRPSTPWLSVQERGNQVVVTTPQGEEVFDFVFAATGAFVDLAQRPEFAGILPHVALWSERYQAPADKQEPRLEKFPYLGQHAEFQEKTPGSAPWVQRVFTITRAATLSMGPSAASNSNIKYTAPRMIAGITKALFLADAPLHAQRFAEHDHTELAGV